MYKINQRSKISSKLVKEGHQVEHDSVCHFDLNEEMDIFRVVFLQRNFISKLPKHPPPP